LGPWRPIAQSNNYVYARFLEVERVGVALASEAHYGNLAARDQTWIGVGFVVHRCHVIGS
jgi:hypothetical protein